jgi:hypothetical protein
MTVAYRRLPALFACVALASCKPAAEVKTPEAAPPASTAPAATPAAPVTFSHDPKLDAVGYYLADTAVQSGNLKLTSLNIGQARDFADWEAGKRPAENELGQVNHTVTVRVMPTAYRVDGQDISFHGVDPNLGQVTLIGALDVGALRAAKTAGPGHLDPVMKGDLQIGDQQFRNVVFKYFGGE